jgi:AcrR family transcriptional regulator
MSSSSASSLDSRRQRQREEARQAILDAAEQLLEHGGFESVSMRKLAARCGYTPPTIYHYFTDKAGLLDALVELRVSDAVEAFRRVQLGPDACENLRRLFNAFAAWGIENPTHYELLTVQRQRTEALPAAEEIRGLLQQPVDALHEDRRLRTDLETARQAFWALVHGLISLRRSRPDVDWTPELTARSIDAMIDGLVLPEPR